MILVGDIGGTSARFALYAHGKRCGLAELDTVRFPTAEKLLDAALEALPAAAPAACCFAVAGPVLDGKAQLTNAPIVFEHDAVAASTGVAQVALVNDLVALGTAVANLPERDFELLDGAPAAGSKAVVSAGTGLGMAVVVDGRCMPSRGRPCSRGAGGRVRARVAGVHRIRSGGTRRRRGLGALSLRARRRGAASRGLRGLGCQAARHRSPRNRASGLGGGRPGVPYDRGNAGRNVGDRQRRSGGDGLDARRRLPSPAAWRSQSPICCASRSSAAASTTPRGPRTSSPTCPST